MRMHTWLTGESRAGETSPSRDGKGDVNGDSSCKFGVNFEPSTSCWFRWRSLPNKQSLLFFKTR